MKITFGFNGFLSETFDCFDSMKEATGHFDSVMDTMGSFEIHTTSARTVVIPASQRDKVSVNQILV